MSPSMSRRASLLAGLSVVAVAASVLAGGLAPVAADEDKADAAAQYSACVGPATADAGFRDVAAGSQHDAAVNCIAYYGITRGTGEGVFSPDQTISRWQLAVMLQRAAGLAGVTLPAASDAGFADIGGLEVSSQAAVNQMAALGVMSGVSAMSFDPDRVVSRAAAAEALARFLAIAGVGPGGRALSADDDGDFTIKESAAAEALEIAVDETFLDIWSVPYAAHQAILALTEMGVVPGDSDESFNPAGSVTRAQAAAFITRALAHTNARPAGLTVQASKAAVTRHDDLDLAISLRDGDFAPIDGASVDVFSYLSKNAAKAFKSDGTCHTGSSGVVADTGGVDACVIEIDDEKTAPDGNLTVAIGHLPTESTVHWAWTGRDGDKLDWNASGLSMDNSAVSGAASVTVGAIKTPDRARVTLSLPKEAEGGNKAAYGAKVTVTIQLVDSEGEDFRLAGQSYTWWASGRHVTQHATIQLGATETETVTTDARGRASFTFTQADPDTDESDNAVFDPDGDDDDRTVWDYYISPVSDAAFPADNPDIGFNRRQGVVEFEDDDPEPRKLGIDLQRSWTAIPASGAAPRVRVTGKVTDQYGNPMRNQAVYFDLDGDGNFGCSDQACSSGQTAITDGKILGTAKRTTRSNGTAFAAASRRTEADTTSNPNVPATPNNATYRVAADIDGDGDVADAGERAEADHFWAMDLIGWDAGAGTAPVGGDGNDNGVNRLVRMVDFRRNTIVKDTNQPGDNWAPVRHRVFSYKGNDIFRYYVRDGAGDPDDQGEMWISTAAFEDRLSKHLTDGIATGRFASVADSETQVAIYLYRTKGGFSVFSVSLRPGSDIGDPPSP